MPEMDSQFEEERRLARDLDDFVKLRAQARLEEWDCRTTDEWLSLLQVSVEICNALSSEKIATIGR